MKRPYRILVSGNDPAVAEGLAGLLARTSCTLTTADNDEKAANRLDSMEKQVAELRRLEEHVKKVDVNGVRRDIESLDAKHKWLENRMDSINLDGIIEKITELEALIQGMKAVSPIVIE